MRTIVIASSIALSVLAARAQEARPVRVVEDGDIAKFLHAWAAGKRLD